MPVVTFGNHNIQSDEVVRMERDGYYGVKRLIIHFRNGTDLHIVHDPKNGVNIDDIEAEIRAAMSAGGKP
jgi:hypothetical protein